MAGKNPKRERKSGSGIAHRESNIAKISLTIALPEERKYFHEFVSARTSWKVPSERDGAYFCTLGTEDGPVRVRVNTLSSMGQTEAVLGAAAAISAESPDLAVMIGIAGSMQPTQVGLGDVVLCNQVKFFGSDKVGSLSPSGPYVLGRNLNGRLAGQVVVDDRDKFMESSFLRYERSFVESSHAGELVAEVETRLMNCPLRQLNPDWLDDSIAGLDSSKRNRKIHVGWILGSAHVVDSREYRDYLNEKNTQLDLDIHRQKGEVGRVQWKEGQLLAVDMESYGLIRAAEMYRSIPSHKGGCNQLIGAVSVRGISDLCEDKGALDAKSKNEVRRLAMHNATEVALSLLENLDYKQLADAKRSQL